jgi:hypothetical protein
MTMDFRRFVSPNGVAVAIAVGLAAAPAAALAQVDRPPATTIAQPPANAPQVAPAPVPRAERARVPGSPQGAPADLLKARYQLRVMEGVLENAVQHGIRSVGAQMRLVTPDVIFFGNPARARGFRLEGFGTFFDVDVPTLRPSVAWSVRTLSQMSPDTTRALASLRRIVASQGDERARKEAEQALRLVELQVGPVDEPLSATGTGQASPPVDPRDMYSAEVTRALVEAMLDYGNTMNLVDADWLAVAARGNDAMGQDAVDNVTVLLKIRGSDLNALRVGTLSRDEVRQRVSVTEF